jgi:hypothetical protein
MPITDSLTPREMRHRLANEDALGVDRLARSFLRTVVRQGPGCVAHIQGAPGSGKTELMRRCMYYVEQDRDALGTDVGPELFGTSTWYNPWTYAKQGNLLAGLVATIARSAGNIPSHIDRARDIVSQMNRMRFDGTVPEGAGSALSPQDADPVDRMRRGFANLVDQLRAGARGRLVIFVADLDQLPAPVRLAFLDGMRLLLGGGAEVAVIIALGRESGLAAVRAREGDISEVAASRILDEMVDVVVTMPKVEIRRVGSLLRRYFGPNEVVLRRAFGEDALNALIVAATHRPLGIPRFLERLAARVMMLADFTLESRAMRELSEAQWAWVVLSERWPDFRRFMIRGGRDRWMQLKVAVNALTPDATRPAAAPADILEWLRDDLLLADYLRLHADGFDRDNMGVYWVEDLLLQAGL